MSTIFLSYRRDDSAGFAGRLSDELEAKLGAGSVFRDVDDIRPGEDFVAAINSQLDEVSVVLVMIGPHWLSTDANGQRRLDQADDFVRLEIQAALQSAKPVIPLLVGGATMPPEAALPPELAGLARRQAITLLDADWKADVARLVQDIQPLVRRGRGPLRNRWRVLVVLAGAGLAAVAAVALIRVWMQPPVPTSDLRPPGSQTGAPGPVAAGAPAAAPKPVSTVDVSGRWSARVKYDWGDAYDEVFEFKLRDGRVRGTAGFLQYPRIIEEGRLQGRWLSFLTHTDEALGDQPARTTTNRYEGEVTREGGKERIRFTLETTGGYSSHVPVEFVAQRAAK